MERDSEAERGEVWRRGVMIGEAGWETDVTAGIAGRRTRERAGAYSGSAPMLSRHPPLSRLAGGAGGAATANTNRQCMIKVE